MRTNFFFGVGCIISSISILDFLTFGSLWFWLILIGESCLSFVDALDFLKERSSFVVCYLEGGRYHLFIHYKLYYKSNQSEPKSKFWKNYRSNPPFIINTTVYSSFAFTKIYKSFLSVNSLLNGSMGKDACKPSIERIILIFPEGF